MLEQKDAKRTLLEGEEEKKPEEEMAAGGNNRPENTVRNGVEESVTE
jgi:hypothetical protein